MKFPSIFKNNQNPLQKWPSCNYPKTNSFRAAGRQDIFKTVNSVFFDSSVTDETVQTPESWFTNSLETTSFSTETDQEFDGESIEVVVRGARSERLFYEPGDTSSILEEAKPSGGFPFKESVVMAMESEDPYRDFKRSIEEMVESHGIKDWECLEELLGWYLKVNGKNNHEIIVGAFVDVVVGIAESASSSSSSSSNYSDYSTANSFSSAVSSFSSNLTSFKGGSPGIKEEDKLAQS